MFLDKMMEVNPELIDLAMQLHQQQKLAPDTYVVDVDTLLNNARLMLDEANKHSIQLYFMLKQLGRNPWLAKELMKLGYRGAVVVDYREAEVMMQHQIPISNVGHLVQPCHMLLQKLVDYGCEYFTVYSLDKIQDLNTCAQKAGKVQAILLRVYDDNDLVYSGQTAGFSLSELKSVVKAIQQLKHIRIAGVTSFPCFLYNEKLQEIESTHNLTTVLAAKEQLQQEGITIENLNTPSTTSFATLQKMAEIKATSGEPGHGLTGTTPMHAQGNLAEIPCVVYLSEVSHNFQSKGYCFGGGHYRRSHLENALVGTSLAQSRKVKVILPDLDSIDYHFGLSEECRVNDAVIMAFRFQIFVTRSQVCLIRGLSGKKPEIVGLYNSLGGRIDE